MQSYHSAILAGVAITSRRNPLVARYRAAARGEADGVVLLDGEHLVGEALRADVAVEHVAVTPAAHERNEQVLAALARAGAEIDVVSAKVMDALSPVRSSADIVALAVRPGPAAGRLYAGATPLVVIAVDVQDPGNLGAIGRVAEAAGASGLVAAGASADPFGWKALRGSMGSSLRLPVVRSDSESAVVDARHHKCRIVAAVPRDAPSIYEVDLTGPMAILIGGEGHGLPPGLVSQADERVTIPMRPPVESLNAAIAAALLVYEAHRQRKYGRT